MATTVPESGMETDVHFPKAGVDLSVAFCKQPARPLPDGSYARTTVDGQNVRAYEINDRIRGGSRSGLTRIFPGQVSGDTFIVQDLHTIIGTFPVPGGIVLQTSNSGRVVFLVAVSAGRVFWITPGGTTWTEATNNTGETPALNYTGVLYSSPNIQKLWFADGINYVYFDPQTNTLQQWLATAGTLPVDSDNNTPRLIVTWRGRTVLSGLVKDPQNWFMSRIDVPTDFDYAPLSPGPSDAVAGNNAPLGLIGDCITTMIPYTDDILIFGGQSSIWRMQGDPADGGRSDLVSDKIGMAWGQPWAKDPYGSIYFVSNNMGIYTMQPAQAPVPVRISQGIEQRLQDVDTGKNAIRCVWDDRFQGLHVFITPLDRPRATTHWFYEQRTGGWFPDVFGNINHNPLCCATLDGNESGNRVAVIGSWDGYVRSVDPTATDDDGTAIVSSVVIGPFLTANLDSVMLYSMQGVLGLDSGTVTYEVMVGETAEEALAKPAISSGTWKPGRNLTSHIRKSGHAIWIKLSSSNPWAMESIRCRMGSLGKVRQRGGHTN